MPPVATKVLVGSKASSTTGVECSDFHVRTTSPSVRTPISSPSINGGNLWGGGEAAGTE